MVSVTHVRRTFHLSAYVSRVCVCVRETEREFRLDQDDVGRRRDERIVKLRRLEVGNERTRDSHTILSVPE